MGANIQPVQEENSQVKQMSYSDVVVVTFFLFVLFALMIWITKIAWNISMPEIFGVNKVTFFQAFALLILARVLIRS